MSLEKKGKKEVNKPEHVSEYYIDENIRRQKEEARKLEKEMRDAGKQPEPIIIVASGNVKKASQLSLTEQRQEFIKCATNPVYFIKTYLTIFDQTKGVGGEIIPFSLFNFQEDLIDAYLNERFVIANKYRQAGISTTTCAYIAWYIMFNNNRSVAIVANKLETARDEMMNDVVEFINHCPNWLKPLPDKRDTMKLKRYDNGCELSAFSSKGLRGYTPTLLFWDETAWTEKSDVFWTAAKPTLSTGGRAIFVSTPNGLDPVFYKTFDNARRGENDFKAVELWWFNDPRYNKDLSWIKNRGKENELKIPDEGWDDAHRIKMMDDGWEATSPWFEGEVRSANGDMRKIAQEILCSFLGSGDNFIAEEFLKRIEEFEIKTPIRQECGGGKMWIWEDALPGEDYIMGVDASPGHGDDFSTINILKIKEIVEEKYVKKNGVNKKIKVRRNTAIQVAEFYDRVTPQHLAEIAYQYGIRYNNAYTIVDITGGYGIQTIEKLNDIGYEDIHYSEVTHKPSRDRLQGYIKKSQKTMADGKMIDVDLIPGFFIGNNRASVLIELQRTIHLKDVVIRSLRLLGELKTFVNVPGNRVADHKRTFHDDSIMGLAIALYTLTFDLSRFKNNSGNTKKVLDAMLKVNDPDEIAKKMAKEKKNKNTRVNTFNPTINATIANGWLFDGLKR